MPTHNVFAFHPATVHPAPPSPQSLARNGPCVRVQIEVSNVLAQALQTANQPIPVPVEGIAIIDTGASITSCDASVIARLGINPNGVAAVGTAGGPQHLSTYQARFSFPGAPLPAFEHPRVLGANLSGQSILNQEPVIALIGRDVLSRSVFVYNGSAGVWSLSF
jgi:hypothetical protein